MNRIHRVRDAWFPRVLLVGPMPVSPVTGGVEKGIDMLLRTDLAKRTEMRLFNNYRRPDPRRRLHSRLGYQLGMIRSFRSELNRRPVDLVHVKTSSGINFYQNSLYALAARLSGLPVLLQIHGGKFKVFYQESNFLLQAWIRHALSSVDKVAVLSHHLADRLQAIAPRVRTVVIPNGLEASEIGSLSETEERGPGRMLFMGAGEQGLNLEKGLGDLLEVLPRMLQRYPTSTWILAGLHDPKSIRDYLEGSLEPGTQIEERVRFLPVVAGQERLALFRESSILVLPSHFENMPNLLLEAMAAGMGVVASDVGAIPEMLNAPAGGILFEARDRSGLENAIERLLSFPSLVGEQGRRNRTTLTREYALSVVERKLEKTYRDIVSEWKTHHPNPPRASVRSEGEALP